MSDFLCLSEKMWMFPGCKDDGKDKQHWGKPKSQQERAKSPVVMLERPFIRLLGNLSLYPFSHVVELWPGRPVGKGNGLSDHFLGGSEFIFLSGKIGEDPKCNTFTKTGLARL